MRKLIFTLTALLALSSAAFAQNSDVTLTIQNQRQDSTDFTFEIWANTTSGTTYLGDMDVVISTNSAKWGTYNVSVDAAHNLWSSTAASMVNGTEIAFNATVNIGGTSVTDYPAVGTTKVLLARVRVTPVTGISQTPDFAFITNGSQKTIVNEVYLRSNGRLRQQTIQTPVLNAPAAGTAPAGLIAGFAADMSTPGQADLSWTAPGSDSVLIVARRGSANQTAPTNTITYTANSAFGSGTKVNGSDTVEYVVAKLDGNSTSATVTGLAAGTEYHFAIYRYSGGSGFSEAYGTASTASGFSIFAEPASPSTGIAQTSFVVRWTPGDGTNVIVVVRDTATTAVAPTDTVTYDANTSFSAGDGETTGAGNVVVYNGTNNGQFTVTGLTAGTPYAVDIYDYNGNALATNYNTSALSGTQYTQFTEPATPATNIAFNSVTGTSFDVLWTSGNGDSVLVVARPSATAAVAPGDTIGYAANSSYSAADGDVTGTGNIVLYSGTQIDSFRVTGLTAGVEYAIDIYEFNGDDNYSNYNTTALSGAQITVFDEPTSALSAIAANANSANRILVTWTDPAEVANQFIVVARLSTDAATAPATAREYTADTTYGVGEALGNGFVVYNGDGSEGSVKIVGLDQNETYAFDIYAYTGFAGGDSLAYNYSDASLASDQDVTWLDAEIFATLEGPFDGTDMSSVNITVPSAQPYNAAPWSYSGTETNSSMPANVVDWVLVELRTGAAAGSASTVAFTQAALLLADGSIVAADGSSLPQFELTSEDTYYIAVRHRNHLAVSSASALTDNGTSAFSYNFNTSGATGTDAMYDYNGDGSFYVLYGGWVDPTTNSTIDAGDYSAVFSARNTTTPYSNADANMDGAVNASDRGVVFNNRDYSEQLP